MLRVIALAGALCACTDAFVGTPLQGLGARPWSGLEASRGTMLVGGRSLSGKVVRNEARLQPRMSEEAVAAGVTIKEGSHKVDGQTCYYKVAEPSSPDASVPPLVLVHAWGMNSKHFEKNLKPIAEATGAPVYAVDLLGFGQSDKPVEMVYGEGVWTWQVLSLIEDVIQAEKVFLGGNSLGGYVCMNLAENEQARIAGVCVLNAVGRYGLLNPLDIPLLSELMAIQPVANVLGGNMFKKAATADGARAALEEVYHDTSKVTGELVDNVVGPAQGDYAKRCGPELYSYMFSTMRGKEWDDLVLEKKRGYMGPILGIWGQYDPWVLPMFAEQLKEMRPDMQLEMVPAGHCPHDECPDAVNAKISEWMKKLAANPAEFQTFVPLRKGTVPLGVRNLF